MNRAEPPANACELARGERDRESRGDAKRVDLRAIHEHFVEERRPVATPERMGRTSAVFARGWRITRPSHGRFAVASVLVGHGSAQAGMSISPSSQRTRSGNTSSGISASLQ